jgi:hypothetical protein
VKAATHTRSRWILLLSLMILRAGFRQITLQGHWKTAGREAEFLRATHKRACRYFRVAIGPQGNRI